MMSQLLVLFPQLVPGQFRVKYNKELACGVRQSVFKKAESVGGGVDAAECGGGLVLHLMLLSVVMDWFLV
jgi:hypothetical protein